MMRLPIAPLFVPASKPALFAKAEASEADAVILDLEDAVAPNEKGTARQALTTHGLTQKPVIVRINGAQSPWFDEDLAALRAVRFDAVILPKAERATDVARIIKVLGRDMPVIALVESAKGLASLSDILSDGHVIALAIGTLDLAVDLDCTPDFEPLLMARSELVLRSRLAGRAGPIDGVTTEFNDTTRVSEDAKRVRALGFTGKLAIHPRQVRPILDAMRPSQDEIVWAKKILGTLEDHSLGSVDGAMVDAPVIQRARHILERAKS